MLKQQFSPRTQNDVVILTSKQGLGPAEKAILCRVDQYLVEFFSEVVYHHSDTFIYLSLCIY